MLQQFQERFFSPNNKLVQGWPIATKKSILTHPKRYPDTYFAYYQSRYLVVQPHLSACYSYEWLLTQDGVYQALRISRGTQFQTPSNTFSQPFQHSFRGLHAQFTVAFRYNNIRQLASLPRFAIQADNPTECIAL